ncbi:hypothetical protein [Leptospira brenneri]|uniref:Uncharacterized protein n=1 Tax=Leptospira brenneri TaxID=2023182 RepID=A0A5F1Z8V4_9LEPT|nr:hypothetical protein [Leptospira brenneri]TGK95077.1 hypothetical protein EHQ30_00010 [Leptospira brenneri]
MSTLYRESHFGFFFNISGNDDIRTLSPSSEFRQKPWESYGRGTSVSFFYNTFDYQSIILKLYSNSTPANSGYTSFERFGQSFGIYEYKSKTVRPDIELAYKFYIFRNGFYLSPVVGLASPRSVEYQKSTPFFVDKKDGLYTFSYESSSRLYGGVDIGFTWTIFENFLINLGYGLKYSDSPRIRYNSEYTINDSLLHGDFNMLNLISTAIITRSNDTEYTFVKRGSSSLYIEAGYVF